MYKIVFFVPSSYLESVKSALFNAGAGRIGDYSECCWESEGVGQFKPLAGSSPFLGKLGELTKVKEFRVELVCEDAYIKASIAALRNAHPYEEPAVDVWQLLDEKSLP